MDKEKIEFLDLKRQVKTLKEQSLEDSSNMQNSNPSFSKNATNPIIGVFKTFTALRKFNIDDIKDL